jgi:hypothetical protein
MVDRVIATPAALDLIDALKGRHGPALMFHQSGGCCDNSSPNCYLLPTDLTVGPYDLKLGEIGGVPFYMGAAQYEYWKHTQLIIDVVSGQGGNFSLEAGSGKAFITRSRLFSDDEWNELEAAGLV